MTTALLLTIVAMSLLGSACGGGGIPSSAEKSSPSRPALIVGAPGPCPVVQVLALGGLSLRAPLIGSRSAPPAIGASMQHGQFVIEELRIDVLVGPYVDNRTRPNVVTGTQPYLQRFTSTNLTGEVDRVLSFVFTGIDVRGNAVAPGIYDVALVFNAVKTADSTCDQNGGTTQYHGRVGTLQWKG